MLAFKKCDRCHVCEQKEAFLCTFVIKEDFGSDPSFCEVPAVPPEEGHQRSVWYLQAWS